MQQNNEYKRIAEKMETILEGGFYKIAKKIPTNKIVKQIKDAIKKAKQNEK